MESVMIKRILMNIILLLSTYPCSHYAQNEAPVVENVTFSQRTDGTYIVDVLYDIYDSDGDTLTIFMKVSNDDGISWNFSCENTTGDIGSNILSGTAKHIVWDFRAEHPDTCCDKFKIKIIADDGVNIGIPCPGIPSITDLRNGEVYETVLIGEQCWLKRNINIGTRVDGVNDMYYGGGIEKYCYNDDEDNCNKYGGLYQWGEAMQYEVEFRPVQGICPDGWHIPWRTEFDILRRTVSGQYFGSSGANALKAVGQGGGDGAGTNASGFSALLVGIRTTAPSDNYFRELTLHTSFWGYEVGERLWYFNLNFWDDGVDHGEATSEVLGYSVRCLKD